MLPQLLHEYCCASSIPKHFEDPQHSALPIHRCRIPLRTHKPVDMPAAVWRRARHGMMPGYHGGKSGVQLMEDTAALAVFRYYAASHHRRHKKKRNPGGLR
jgi:hypothetical protein